MTRYVCVVVALGMLCASFAFAQRTVTFNPGDVQATDVRLVPLADGGVALVEQCLVAQDGGLFFAFTHTMEPRTDGGRSAVSALQSVAVRSCVRALHLSDAGAQ